MWGWTGQKFTDSTDEVYQCWELIRNPKEGSLKLRNLRVLKNQIMHIGKDCCCVGFNRRLQSMKIKKIVWNGLQWLILLNFCQDYSRVKISWRVFKEGFEVICQIWWLKVLKLEMDWNKDFCILRGHQMTWVMSWQCQNMGNCWMWWKFYSLLHLRDVSLIGV